MGGHIAYEVKGEDKMGKFEGLRRYNEFHALREKLLARWPGIYIPQIPPKKAYVSLSLSESHPSTEKQGLQLHQRQAHLPREIPPKAEPIRLPDQLRRVQPLRQARRRHREVPCEAASAHDVAECLEDQGCSRTKRRKAIVLIIVA